VTRNADSPVPPPAVSTDDVDEAYCPACSQSYPVDTKVCAADGAKLILFRAKEDPMIGRVLDQRYQVRSPLGRGGMGTVYRAWQLSVDREVALKVVHGKLTADRAAAKRFLREARLASRLSQPNIVNVYDFGQTPDDGALYLVMELLRGRTLQAELAGGRKLPTKRVVTIALQLCDALEAAHAAGIVHRDLKPGNMVILDEPAGRDLLKVLDFGLAKSLVSDTSSQVTNTDAILGTPLYMSPESVQGQPADHRSDLYAMGCILYEALAGRAPFVEASINLVMAKHLSEPPPPLPSTVPAPLRALIERLLAKTPADRPQSAAEVRAVLEQLASGGAFAVSDVPGDTSDTVPELAPVDFSKVGVAATLPHIERTATVPAPSARLGAAARPRWLLPVGLVAAAGAGVLAFALTRGGPPSAAPAAPSAPAAAPASDARQVVPTPDAAPPSAPVPAVTPDAAPAPDARPKRPGGKKPGGKKPGGDPDIGLLPT
jgi:tRNA A-37 threonylcarbamoyl transferase component Bud32